MKFGLGKTSKNLKCLLFKYDVMNNLFHEWFLSESCPWMLKNNNI